MMIVQIPKVAPGTVLVSRHPTSAAPARLFSDCNRLIEHDLPIHADRMGLFPVLYAPDTDLEIVLRTPAGHTAVVPAPGCTLPTGATPRTMAAYLPVGAIVYMAGTHEPPGYRRLRRHSTPIERVAAPGYTQALAERGEPYGGDAASIMMPGQADLFQWPTAGEVPFLVLISRDAALATSAPADGGDVLELARAIEALGREVSVQRTHASEMRSIVDQLVSRLDGLQVPARQ